jgi:hypothetical protein
MGSNPSRLRKALGRELKLLSRIFLTVTALSSVLQGAPALTSQPLEDFLETKSETPNLKQHFHASAIRIYDRHNVLYPFHLAGQAVRWQWQEKKTEQGAGDRLADVAAGYAAALFRGVEDILPFSSPLSAFSIADHAAVAERTCFVRPPGKTDITDYLREMSGLALPVFTTRNAPEKLADAFFLQALLHEARHCDQERGAVATSVLESDADLYAFGVLEAHPELVDRQTLGELKEIWSHLRFFEAVTKGPGHFTTYAIERGSLSGLEAERDEAALFRFRNIVRDLYALNAGLFADGYSTLEGYYFVAKALLRVPALREDAELAKAATGFIAAVEFFDSRSANSLLKKTVEVARVEAGFLTDTFLPVPNKIKLLSPG